MTNIIHIVGASGARNLNIGAGVGTTRIQMAGYGRILLGWKSAIEARSISADDVTWAILPYVDGQYGN